MIEVYEKISIRIGLEEDIDQILSLQNFWLQKTAQSKQGFLFGSPYSKRTLYKIVQKEEVVVAVVEGNFAGFFLMDSISENDLTKTYEKLLKTFYHHFKGKTCPRAQIAISPEYLGLGVSKLLTESLIKKVNYKYDAVFSVVSKKNKNMSKHLKNGWEVIHEDGDMYYVKLDLN